MATRSQKVKLGVFLTVSIVLFVGTLIVLTGMEMWQERTLYYVNFTESVSGLEKGAPVKLRGVRVGTVDDIRVEPGNVEVVEVTLAVERGTPIKRDTKAYINMQGITGLKFIELQGGTADAERLPPGGNIPPGKGLLDELTGRASDIGLKIEKVLNNTLYMTRQENQKKVDAILTHAESSMASLDSLAAELEATLRAVRALIEANHDNAGELLVNLNQAAAQLSHTLRDVQATSTEIRGTVAGMDLPETVAGVRETNALVQQRLQSMEVGEAVQRVTATLGTLQVLLQQLTETVGQNQHQISATMQNLRQATQSLKEFSRDLELREKNSLIFGDAPEERELP